MEPEQVIHVVVKIIMNNYNKAIGLDALCLLNWIWMFLNQQARSQGTIMFKVVPITERPVHQKMMVGRPPRQLLQSAHSIIVTPFSTGSSAVRPGHGELQPAAGPDHPVCRRRH